MSHRTDPPGGQPTHEKQKKKEKMLKLPKSLMVLKDKIEVKVEGGQLSILVSKLEKARADGKWKHGK